MSLSIFNLFNIGIGPSSSHTVGPMRASNFFLKKLKKHQLISQVNHIKVELYGSLSFTGLGHRTDYAVIAGLAGHKPETSQLEKIDESYNDIRENKKIQIASGTVVTFDYDNDLIFKKSSLPFHPNGMIYYAYRDDELIYEKTFYSVGGGFIVGHKSAENDELSINAPALPYPFSTARELLEICQKNKLSISEVAMKNELALKSRKTINQKLDLIIETMKACINKGISSRGQLPGKMQVERRAQQLHKDLCSRPQESLRDPLAILDWVNLYALAVNEENAAGGRVVTAPTNGASGIIPAVLMYHQNFSHNMGIKDARRFLLTAGTIGILYKMNASISGAEVGCQGEVGVACSMAAAGLTEVLGGTPSQVENAAEIGMEHNLGLTCDPVDGQVQIPCIERNAMASVKAINASRIALKGTGGHRISLDEVMKTMKETGLDMQEKYKETSKGGLAVNVTGC